MKRKRLLETIGASVGITALTLAGLTVSGAAIAAEPVVISSVDFTDGTYGGWTASGGAPLSVVEIDGNPALQVSNRTQDFEGIQSPASLFSGAEVGDDYTFSMRVRLAEGTPSSAGVRFVMKPAYAWIGNTTMTADAWTTVSGTYRIPSGTPSADFQVYIGTGELDPAGAYTYLVDDIVVTALVDDEEPTTPTNPGTPGALNADFEVDLGGWAPRADSNGISTVAVSSLEAHTGTQSALISGRTSQGHGIGHNVTGILEPGTTYDLSAWVKFAAGQPAGPVWLSLATTVGGTTSYGTVDQFPNATMSNTEWVNVTTSFQMGAADDALLYFETAYANGDPGNTSDFFIDDITVTAAVPAVIQDLTPIKDTVDFPVGVAIDNRETTGSAAELLTRHFNQVTSENYMKPDAWYTADRTFSTHPQATTLMEFAQTNDLDVYGHTLVWHSQTPAWFFQNASGDALTNSAADQEIMRERMRTHIFNVAESMSDTYGLFGSATNPLTAFDVVNEVVADGTQFEDGLRRSEWYRILGEEFIDLAFIYADEAFNDEFAAPGSNRPVTLFINDYNTEQGGKQSRLLALVERMLERNVPVDGVGHQFHVSLAMPVAALEAAIVAFQGLGLTQAVTELDVTIGTPETEANLVEQGYYYRDAFRAFRAHSADLFAVTVWGLTDGRSWRSGSGAPLVFNNSLQAKPAYYGIVDGALPNRQRAANVFAGDVALGDTATDAIEWRQLRLRDISDAAGFELRWAADHLTVFVNVDDTTVEGSDGVTFELNGAVVTLNRDGTGNVPGVVTERAGGYSLVAHVPFAAPAAQGGTAQFDVRVTDGASTTAWNTPGATGTLTLVEPLSYVEILEVETVPVIDGEADEAWALASVVSTDKRVEGTSNATAEVRTLWNDSTLYIYAEVTDPDVDVSGSDPWIQDSVEFYVDAGNFKNGSYRYDDTQIRISATNVVSFGTGDEGFQRNRLESQTRATETGYVVEAAISLLEDGGLDTFHGVDFQVNDASNGARTAIHNWADPTGAGYQSTARWGVARLVAELTQPGEPGGPGEPGEQPTITLGSGEVRAGEPLAVALAGFGAGEVVEIVLDNAPVLPAADTFAIAAVAAPLVLATITVDGSGAASQLVTIPATVPAGAYSLAAVVGGVVLAAAPITVLAADAGVGGGTTGPGALAVTGVEAGVLITVALLLLLAGLALMLRVRAQRASAFAPAALTE